MLRSDRYRPAHYHWSAHSALSSKVSPRRLNATKNVADAEGRMATVTNLTNGPTKAVGAAKRTLLHDCEESRDH